MYNRNFSISDRIEYMGWVNEGVLNNNHHWQNYKPRFLALKGADLILFDSPPVSTAFSEICVCIIMYFSLVEHIRLEHINANVQSLSNNVSSC